MDDATSWFIGSSLVFIVLAGLAGFFLFRSQTQQIRRGKVTSSTARISDPTKYSPKQGQQVKGRRRKLTPKRQGPYAPNRNQYIHSQSESTHRVLSTASTRSYRVSSPEELHYSISSPNRTSAESSPLHSPYVHHPKPPTHHYQELNGHVSNHRDLETQNTFSSNSSWQDRQYTRTSLHPNEIGSYAPLVPGSIRSPLHSHSTELKHVKQDNNRNSYRPPPQMTNIRIGPDLIPVFASLSEESTNQNIETVGILGGFMSDQDEFILSHLIIPEQQGTHDTCEVLNDEMMPNLLAEHELVQLGWIHVHPQYEAFLSSVDLHTHFSYQMMLPESIAIVWAPTTEPTYGIFSMTKEGMKLVENCQARGFHKHPSEPIAFETAHHALLDDEMPAITVLDLRNKMESSQKTV